MLPLISLVLQARVDDELVQSILDSLHHHRIQHGVAIVSTFASLIVPDVASAFEQADRDLKPKIKRSTSLRLRLSPRPTPTHSPSQTPRSLSPTQRLDLEVPKHVKKSKKRHVLHPHELLL